MRIWLSSSFLRHCDESQILLKSQPQIWAIGADGEQCEGAGNIADALARGEIAAQAISWSLGFEPVETFSVNFQGHFRNATSENGALNIRTLGPGPNSASLEVGNGGLLATMRCDGVDVEIQANKPSGRNGIGDFDSPDTTVVSGLSAFRWRSLEFQGRLKIGNTVQDIRGTAYFQQVRSHIPLLPWDWCYCVLPNGCRAGISTLRLGSDLFASERYIESDRISRFNKRIFSRGFFLDGETGRSFRMTRSRVVGSTAVDGKGRVKHIVARDEEGTRMQFDVVIQDTHALQFSRGKGVLSIPAFHYRSSLGAVENFVFERQGHAHDYRSFDAGCCNLERTFGLML